MPRRSPPPEHRVVVSVAGGPFAGLEPRTLRRRAHKMLTALELEASELSVALVDDERMRVLNRDYRRLDKPTDVLAFALREGEDGPTIVDGVELLGDVIVSVPTARRQAVGRHRSLLDELTMLVAHGLLHLLGFDHRTKAEERDMVARTQRLEAAARRRT